MCYILPNSTLLMHIPKTGGQWARAAIAASGILVLKQHSNHETRDQVGRDWRFTFAFVREPVSWYVSLYRYMNDDPARWTNLPIRNAAWGWPNEICRLGSPSLSFHDWIVRVAESEPAYLSRLYDRFIDDRVDYVGRIENLYDNLIHALETAGFAPDRDRIYNHPPINRSHSAVPDIDADLAAYIRSTEHVVLERFYPEEL